MSPDRREPRHFVRLFRLGIGLVAGLAGTTPHAAGQDPARTPPAPDSAWWSPQGRVPAGVEAPRYQEIRRSSRYVTMRDGVRLAIDVYLPAGLEPGARLPAILQQTRYYRSLGPAAGASPEADRPRPEVREFVTRGYAWIHVDVRGTGASFGTRAAELDDPEVRDGNDLVNWIVQQPWSDGKVGATGVSYDGTTSELLLRNRHPAVKAIAPRFSLWDAYDDIAAPGGLNHTWFLTVWGQANRRLDDNALITGEALKTYTGVRPVDGDSGAVLLKAAVKEHGGNVDIVQTARFAFRDDTAANGKRLLDGFSPYHYTDEIRGSGAAIYNYGGWFDGGYGNSVINRFRSIRGRGHRLVIGPWTHGAQYFVTPGRETVRSSFDHTAELLRFFDYHLKGRATGIADEPPVRYFTMNDGPDGAGRWRTARDWPIAEARGETWHFASEGRLVRSADPARGHDRYVVDTTTGTGDASRWNTLFGGRPVYYPDRAAAAAKLLVYTSPPLAGDMEVTGHPAVTLQVRSSAADGQFLVYLEAIDSAGRAWYVTEGGLRALHRVKARAPYETTTPFHSFRRADARPLIPNEWVTLSIDLLPTSYVFRSGYRIRVAIAGADRDHFAPLPEPGPTLEIERGGPSGSRIELPVVPRSP